MSGDTSVIFCCFSMTFYKSHLFIIEKLFYFKVSQCVHCLQVNTQIWLFVFHMYNIVRQEYTIF